jgi:hypothetical protein
MSSLGKNQTSWLMHSWSTFGAGMSHERTQIHKTHHGPDLGEATTFPLIVYFVPGHGVDIQMAFCPVTPKWEFQNSQSCDSHNFGGAYLRWKWGLKQSCSPCRDLSNLMSHTTFTQGNLGDSWFLVVGSQIANLTPTPSFGHNLCFRCPNESCEPMLDISVPRVFPMI